MTEPYVLDAVRTPRGKAKPDGGLATVTPLRLVEILLHALPKRSGLDPGWVDDVVLGCVTQVDDQGGGLARTAVLTAGWPVGVPGATINRYCSSGLDAVAVAAAMVRSGQADLVVAGGVESVSRVPMFADNGPLGSEPEVMRRVGSVPMGIAADVIATEQGYDRAELDAYGLRTQRCAAAAWREGRFDRSLVPVRGDDGEVLLDHDEHVRANATDVGLRALEPAFADLGAQGSDAVALAHLPSLPEIRHLHTRGTSPSLADGAGLVLVGSGEAARRLDLAPRARIVTAASAGGDPVRMLLAGQQAVEKALRRTALSPDDIDIVEFAESFAAVCVKIQRELGIGDERFNVNGGTIAMGHAFGATGAILVACCVDELDRSRGRYGVTAVSGAAGSGAALVLERVA